MTFPFTQNASLVTFRVMPLPADYHMHTPLCRHASGEPTEYAAQALTVGLTEIGFSDHSPMNRDDFDCWRMRLDQLDEYVAKVRKAKTDHPDLTIKLALEVDFIPGYEDWIRDLTARHPWDYLIGSVHYVSNQWVIDDPSQISEWKNHDPNEVWAIYFDRLTRAVEARLFDIIGHADLPKKFGIKPPVDCASMMKPFIKACAKTGVAVELNTAGLRKECQEIYPSPEIVRLLFENSIPITFGSDAHGITEVGMNFKEAIQLAEQSGYRQSCIFTQRERTMVAW